MRSTIAAEQECVLATMPGLAEHDRTLVVLVSGCKDGTRISLRQQTYGDGVGWFTQKSLDLEPAQAALLRTALGGSAVVSRSHLRSGRPAAVGDFPRLALVESA